MGQLTGFGLCHRQQLAHVVRRQRRMRKQHKMHIDHLGDRRKVFHWIDRHLRDQVLVHAEVAKRAHEKCVAVGRRARGQFGADHAARPAAIFDHNLLAPALPELGREDAGGNVSAAASGKCNDDFHWAIWIPGAGRRHRLRLRTACCNQHCTRNQALDPAVHVHLHELRHVPLLVK